jgi:hypothetical protein
MKLSNIAYIRNFFLSAFLCVGLAVGFNLLVDPYGLFRIVDIEGFNVLKPEFGRNLIHSKMAAVRYVRPTSVIIGTSRTDQGYNPDHPAWSGSSPVRFNLGTGGANIYRIYRIAQHAQANQALEQIILALDFLSFNAIRGNDGNIDNYVDVTVDGTPRPFARFHGLVPGFMSFDAIASSLETVRNQNLDTAQSTYLPNGARHKVGRNIQRRAFYLSTAARFARSVYFPPPKFIYSFEDNEARRSSFTYFRRLMALAYENQIDAKIVLNPVHAYLMETVSRTNLWNRFEEWKQTLVEINEEEAIKHEQDPYPIWDFSGYNSITTQSIPEEDTPDGDEFFYFEASHFKPHLGDLVLDRIFGYQDPQRSIPDDFGVRLTSASIDEHLANIRAARALYRQTHSDEVEDVKEAIAQPFRRVRNQRRAYRDRRARQTENTVEAMEDDNPTED